MFFSARFSARSAAWRTSCKAGLAIVLAAVALAAPQAVAAKEAANKAGQAPVATVSVEELPVEAAQTIVLIHRGGPFPYSKDGSIFGNRERLLPIKSRGYYREYTVKTVGARDRGARRLVCGGENAKSPEACFYTDDHYASFRRVAK